MHITFKLYATLTEYLPEGADKHSLQVEVDDDITAFNLIDRFKVPREKAFLVLVNGIYLNPADRDKPVFTDGDTLAIWPPVAGG